MRALWSAFPGLHPALRLVAHRPWPLPRAAWVGRQSWCDLLFAHWPVPLEALRRHVPAELELQSCEGSAWLGVVPFRMHDVMLRGVPGLPFVSAFPELNLRTYVAYRGKPGVWFFSLDAANRLAVWAARRFVHLPYHHAAMRLVQRAGGRFHFAARRHGSAVAFSARYAPCSDPRPAQPGTLEHFLTERYCLYARDPGGRLFCTDVHHAPWPLQRAEAVLRQADLTAALGLSLRGAPELLHFASRVDVITWAPQPA
jgi:uncharacterized protein YqjF (DUF2071 family)